MSSSSGTTSPYIAAPDVQHGVDAAPGHGGKSAWPHLANGSERATERRVVEIKSRIDGPSEQRGRLANSPCRLRSQNEPQCAGEGHLQSPGLGPRGRVVENAENALTYCQGIAQDTALASTEGACGIDPVRLSVIDDGWHHHGQRCNSRGDLVSLVLDLVLDGTRQPDVTRIAEKIETSQAGEDDQWTRVRTDDHVGTSRRENSKSCSRSR